MRNKRFAFIFALVTLGIAFGAQAHDPKEHMKDAERPDCKAMAKMDHSKMDMDDPVMQAMMKQCMEGMHHGQTEAEADDKKIGMTDAKKSDCKAMAKMDHGKMDMDDPVMQAMMKQCMEGMHHGQTEAKHGNGENQEGMTDAKRQHAQHQH